MTNYMASPQVEQGFTKIANELLEALYGATNLNATQYKIILLIIRATYGYQKTEHEISVSFISQGIQYDSRQLRRELNTLIELSVIKVVKEATFQSSRVLSLNKNYEEWGLNRPERVNLPPGGKLDQRGQLNPEGELTHSTEGNSTPSTEGKFTPQKRKYKENIKKSANTHFTSYDDLFEKVWKLYPNKKGKSSVSIKSKKELEEVGEENLIKAIGNFKKYCDKNEWYTPMYGSKFFNGAYQDYLPSTDEKPKIKPSEPREIKTLDAQGQEKLFQRMEEERQEKIRLKNIKLGRVQP